MLPNSSNLFSESTQTLDVYVRGHSHTKDIKMRQIIFLISISLIRKFA